MHDKCSNKQTGVAKHGVANETQTCSGRTVESMRELLLLNICLRCTYPEISTDHSFVGYVRIVKVITDVMTSLMLCVCVCD